MCRRIQTDLLQLCIGIADMDATRRVQSRGPWTFLVQTRQIIYQEFGPNSAEVALPMLVRVTERVASTM